jgi:hypothetical protein
MLNLSAYKSRDWVAKRPADESLPVDNCMVNVVAAIFVSSPRAGSSDDKKACKGIFRSRRPTSRVLVFSVAGLVALATVQMYASISLMLSATRRRFVLTTTSADNGSNGHDGEKIKFVGHVGRMKTKRRRLPYHVNFGAQLMPIQSIPVGSYAQEDLDGKLPNIS